jgi:type I site-specific restriction endonuclease
LVSAHQASFLAIPPPSVEGKKYLAPTTLDKNAQKTRGYFPDFSVWEMALPIMIVEAKAPDVPVDVGYREACLYARHLNSQYKHGVNTSQRSATSSVLSA